MKVTPEMTTDSGMPLSKLADFIGLDGAGVQVVRDHDAIGIVVNSAVYPNERVWLDLDDADGLADLIKAEVKAVRR